MHFNTHVLHKRMRFKHKHLMFRINYPKAYKTLVFFLILSFFGAGSFAYFTLARSTPPVYNDQPALQIQAYSLNGEITSVAGNAIGVKTGIVLAEDNGGKIVYEHRNVAVTPATRIVKIQIQGEQLNTVPGSAADLAIGKSVAIYTAANPAENNQLEADKIEVIEELSQP